MSDSQGPGQREVAYRLFAAEFEDSDLSYSESDEERAPNYVVTPTGARVNRLFAVGVLTEVEGVSEDVLRGRVVDPTGAFVLYAGQYQPDEQAFLERAEPPVFVAVTGKARTFQPEDTDRVFTSVRPETISEVDADTRDRWTVAAAEQTLDRIARIADAKHLDARGDALESTLRDRGFPEGLAEGISLALDHYGTTGDYLGAVRQIALDAARLVADEIEEVDPLDIEPGEGTDAGLSDLTGADLTGDDGSGSAVAESGSPAADVETANVEDSETPETPEPPETAPETSDAGAGAVDDTPVATPETTASEAEMQASGTDVAADSDERAAGSGAGAEPGSEAETSVSGGAGGEEEDLGDFDPAEFELDEEEREEIESEYGTDFQSGTEVDAPGEADIETPEPEAVEEPAEDTDDTAAVAGATVDEEATAVEETIDEDGVAEPADVVDAVVEVMTELDDGAGADRDAVVDEMSERHGISPDDTAEAIQEALMDGRCYEPDDATLKPI